MAAQETEIRYFEFKIGLNSTLDLLAGDTAVLAANGQYKAHNNIDAKTYGAVMSVVRDAFLAGQNTATLIVDGQWIIGVPHTTWQASIMAASSGQAPNKPAGRPDNKRGRRNRS
jgi:hypothetical protein